jgi:oligopeptide/dipeptide ABC transporter ATP-binding protein
VRAKGSLVRLLLHSRLTAVSLAGVGLVALVAIFAPIFLAESARATDLSEAGLGAGQGGHLLGTDALGRDVVERMLVGTRLSLQLALIAAGISCIFGSAIGIALAMGGRAVRSLGGRAIDALLGFPDILLAVLIVTVVGAGSNQAAVAVGVAVIPFFARLSFTLASTVLDMDYVVAAKALGVSPWRRMLRYLAPNVAEPLLIAGFLAISYSIIAISSLSFLGLGVQAPDYDWGFLLTDGLKSIYVTPAAALAPAVAVALAGMLFGIVGEIASRAADPGLRGLDATRIPSRRRVADRLAQRAGTKAAEAARLAAQPDGEAVLAVQDLTVSFPSAADGGYRPVKGVSFHVGEREIVGVVGESGSGKTLTALAIGGLVPYPGTVTATSLRVGGVELSDVEPRRASHLYRSRLAYVFQDPNGSLNPSVRIGTQLTEALPAKGSRRESALQAGAALREVDVSAPEARLRQYPHQLSGGLAQRVAIAMSLLSRSGLVIADEPTTALDVTIQAQVLSVIRRLREDEGLSVLLISHSLGVIGELCDRVIVMYAGRIVEEGPVASTLADPRHPYTRALIAAMPRLSSDRTQPLATIPGRVPQPHEQVTGCAFKDRCPQRFAPCDELPPLFEVNGGRAACWLHAAKADE